MINIKAIGGITGKFILMMALMVLLGFIVPRLMPGNPLTSSVDRALPPDTLLYFTQYYAPEESIWYQLWLYAKHLLRFDLGHSFYYGMPVLELITGRLGWTLFLSLTALLLAYTIAIPMGIWSALSTKRYKDSVAVFSNIVAQSVPVFLIALLIQLVIAYRLNWLPAQGAYTPGITPENSGYYSNVALHSVLPLTALVISLIPSIFILTRNVIMRVKNESFVELARYLNINQNNINNKYILRNSLPEIVSKLNIGFVYAIAGTIFVEIIFSYPGLGTLTKIAVDGRDYPLIQGIFLVIGFYGILVNIVFDFIQQRLNPWLR